MNNQLPEHDWRVKLYSYSSPVDKRLLKKVLDAKNKKGDQPLSFWLILSLLLILISGSLMYLNERTATNINTVKNVPVPMEGIRQEPVKPLTSAEPSASTLQKKNNIQQEGLHHRAQQQSLTNSEENSTKESSTNPDAIKLSTEDYKMQANQLAKNLVYYPNSTNAKSWKKQKYPALLLTDFTEVPASYSLPPLFSPMQGTLNPNSKNELQTVLIPDCPDFGERRNDWYLEVFGALDFPQKKLVDVLGKSDFIAKKDSSEKFVLSYSAGFRVSRNISQSWLLKTGLHLSQFNEKFQYRNENERRITTIVTIRTIVRGPGDTLYVSDSSQVEVTGVRVKTTNNRYRNIDIPLLISYEVRNPGFTIAVQGGTIFNLRSTFHGDMLDTTGFPISQSGKNPASQFNNSLGFGIYAGASFIKSVTSDFDIFAEPYYRRYLNNQASAAAPFEQYLSNWGLQLGVRYKLNKGGQRY